MSWKDKVKICKHCQNKYKGDLKNQCFDCYDFLRRHGSFNPEKWKKICVSCKKDFSSKYWRQRFCTKECQNKVHVLHRRNQYRIENNIPLDQPVQQRSKFGEGHKCKKNGYKIVNCMRHPNASKSGRIYEHTLVMSEYLGRPLRKGETIHHKNGIRHDNRIENLELWDTNHPPGQRVSDKIEWAIDFLKDHGYKVVKE